MRARAYKNLEIHDVDRRDACPPVADMRAGLTGLFRQAPLPLNRNRLSMSAVASSPATGRRRVYRNRLQRMLNSSIGLKITIALTGVILSGFVLVHMLGNLQVYQGAEALDAYGKLLRKEPALLWTFRLVLLSAVGLHIWAVIVLTRKNLQARPQAYQARKYKESSFASRSMIITGPLILLVHHLPHSAPDNRHRASGFSGRRRLPQPGRRSQGSRGLRRL